MINYVLLLSSHESFKNRNKHFLRTVEYVCAVNNVIHETILCNIPLIAATRNNNKQTNILKNNNDVMNISNCILLFKILSFFDLVLTLARLALEYINKFL